MTNHLLKIVITLVCLQLLIPFFNQAQEWTVLKEPRSGILGRQIQNLKTDGSVNFVPGMEVPSVKILSDTGTDYSKEYKERFRSLIVPSFSKAKLNINSIELKKTTIKYISPDDFINGNLLPGTSFAYEGITADTVKVKIVYHRNLNIKPAEILDSFKNYIPTTTVIGGVASKIVNLVAKVQIAGTDSVYDEYAIYNPGVFSRVKFVTFVEGLPPVLRSRNRTWDDYWKHFYERGISAPTGRLYTNKLPIKKSTIGQYPEVWGTGDPKSRVYYLEVANNGSSMKLLLKRNLSNVISTLREIPFTLENGKKHWELEYSRIDVFTVGAVTKNIFIACFANQIDDSTVEIINYEGQANDKNSIATYMKYPEYKIKYINKLN